MNGKMSSVFAKQTKFQETIEGRQPTDDPILFQYHIAAIQEELGELLKADKRWKTHRNTKYDPKEKLDELSDCFITILNLAMWSGFTEKQLLACVDRKIEENFNRLREEK